MKYIDVITYTDSKNTLADWFAENMPGRISYDDEEAKEGVRLITNKTPTYSQGNHSVSLIRVDEADLDWIEESPLEILAQGQCKTDNCPFSKLDENGIIKLRLAYPEYLEVEGETIKRSVEFGLFA